MNIFSSAGLVVVEIRFFKLFVVQHMPFCLFASDSGSAYFLIMKYL